MVPRQVFPWSNAFFEPSYADMRGWLDSPFFLPKVPAALKLVMQTRFRRPLHPHSKSTHDLAHMLDLLDAPDSVRLRATQDLISYANAHNEPRYDIDGDQHPGARYEAAMALAVLNTEPGAYELIRWMDDRSESTRRMAAFALASTGEPLAIEPLTTIALNDPVLIHLGDPPGHPGHPVSRCIATVFLLWIRGAGVKKAFARFSPENWAAVDAYVEKEGFLLASALGLCDYCKLPKWWAEEYGIPEDPRLSSPPGELPMSKVIQATITAALKAARENR